MKSPLFISSIELLAHATELFGSKNDKKFKFIILHLANSIELILKDKLLSCGHSIYSPKNQNLTLTIWDTFNALDAKGVVIPEKHIIELLVDDRNTIQHRFGFPNEEAVFYYLTSTKDFFQRFLKEEYGIDLIDELKIYLLKENLELLGLTQSEIHNLKKLKDISPEMAIIQINSDLEKELNEILNPYKLYKSSSDENFINNYFHKFFDIIPQLLSTMKAFEFIDASKHEEVFDKYKIFKSIRNKISHGSLNKNEIKEDRLNEIFNDGIEILNLIKNAKKNNIFKFDNLDMIFTK